MPIPQRPELNALFNLPPVDAIDYLKKKGFKIGWDWHETLDDAHSRAFTVAKVARIDLLQDIRKSLITALENGQSFEKWKADLTPVLQEKGWWERKTVKNPEGIEQEVQLGSPRRLRTIYDTNMKSAYSAGRYKAMLAGSETRPYWEWRHTTINNPRKRDLVLNGRIFRFDDPFWNVSYPPTGFGCNCYIIARSAREVGDKEILSSEGYASVIYEKVGTDRNSGVDITTRRTQFNIPTQSGETLSFAPAAGFNGSPASSYLIDAVLTKRSTELMGRTKGLQQVEQMLNAPPRIKAHQAFVKNSMSFAKPQNKTCTVGVLQSEEISFLARKNQVVESPIMTISDHLMVGKKAQRHGEAGNAPTTEEWLELPQLIQQVKQVVYDVKNDSILYLLTVLEKQYDDDVLKLSVRHQSGVMEIVSIFKVQNKAIQDGLNAKQYELIR